MGLKDYLTDVAAPKIRGDGGWLDVLAVDGDAVKVQLQGECSKCSIAKDCMDWVCAEVRRDLSREIRIEFVRRKPFFWDTV